MVKRKEIWMIKITLWIVWKEENIEITTDEFYFDMMERDLLDKDTEFIRVVQLARKWIADVVVKRFFIKKTIIDFVIKK